MPPGLGEGGREAAVPQFPHPDLGKSGCKTRWLWEMLLHIFGVLFPGGGWMLGAGGGGEGGPRCGREGTGSPGHGGAELCDKIK